MESRSFQSITETLDLYQVGDHIQDVEKYARDELARIAQALGEEPGDNENWPGEDLVSDFLQRTRGHMLYATTVIRHIDDPYDDPRQRLRNIFDYKFNSTPDFAHSTPFSSLHELYRQILRSCPRANRDTMVEVLEEMLASSSSVSLMDGPPPSLNDLDRLAGRVPGRGIKAMRPLHAVVRLSDRHIVDDGFFYHSSFAEFLKAESPLLPDVTLNFQNGIRRLLMGCLKSLSVIGMDGHVVIEKHVAFSLESWPDLWLLWKADADPDPSQLLKSILAIDFEACLSQKFLPDKNFHPWYHRIIVFGLYHPTNNIITRKVCSPLAEAALLHFRSSVEGASLRILDPVYLSSVPGHQGLFGRFSDLFWHFVAEISQAEHRPPIFNDVVQALRRLVEEQEEIFEKLKWHKPFSLLEEEHISAVAQMFKLARQIEKS
jgi:hypothetical protein